MTPLRLASAGIGLVGVSFGMARYGYGLLLPDMRRAFGLGPAALGLIGTGASALCYPPLSDAASALPGAARERVLAAVSCGTG